MSDMIARGLAKSNQDSIRMLTNSTGFSIGDKVIPEDNDSGRITRALTAAAGKTVVIPPGNYDADGLIIPANTNVIAYGATITGLSGSTAHVIRLSKGCIISGLTINGNKSVKTNGAGIFVPAKNPDFTIEGCHIYDCVLQGISIDIQSNNGRIVGNYIHDCLHGIQWWGGDSQYSKWTSGRTYTYNSSDDGKSDKVYIFDGTTYKYYTCVASGTASSTAPSHLSGTAVDGTVTWRYDSNATIRGVSNLYIAGNIIKNVRGGIWGSLGERISVVGNPNIENCSDVGIDFEGCSYSVAIGNSIKNAINAAMAVFYGSTHVVFSDNTVQNESGYGNAFKAFGKSWTNNLNITVSNNDVYVWDKYAFTCDGSVLADSKIVDNTIKVQVTAPAFRMIDSNKLKISGNTINVATASGIQIDGGSNCVVSDNIIETTYDASTAGTLDGGIRLYWRSGAYPCQKNTVKDNTIKGFKTSILEDCWGDATSYNWIKDNRLDTIYVHNASNPANWKGKSENNVSNTNPNTIIDVTSY